MIFKINYFLTFLTHEKINFKTDKIDRKLKNVLTRNQIYLYLI